MKKTFDYNLQFGKGYSVDVNKPDINHMPEIVPYPQNGGLYNYIINPKTNRKVNLNSKLGKIIIQNYIKYIYRSK